MQKINSLKEQPSTWKEAIQMLTAENPGVELTQLASYANRNYYTLRKAAMKDEKTAEIMRGRMVDLSVNLARIAKEKGVSLQTMVDAFVASRQAVSA